MNQSIHKRIYSTVAVVLDFGPMQRDELISKVQRKMTHGKRKTDATAVGNDSELRARIAQVIDELIAHGLISKGDGGYYLASEKPVILRSEACARLVLEALGRRPMTKSQIRRELERSFGTDKTLSPRDDNLLHSILGKVLKRLQRSEIILLSDGVYSISPERVACIRDIDAILRLKEDFLTRLHAAGGEFFEHYYMTLLGKYLKKHGKTVEKNEVSGGAADGGIDGVIVCVDSLGFRETVMVQMKNRLEETNETVVRGFWGSVCAFGGTRGIFATTSTFHEAARTFLDGIDNCVGTDGDRIFAMACECKYGIKKRGNEYVIDSAVL